MAYAAALFLLDEVIDDAPLGIGVHRQRVFIDVVHQIKIEILNAAFLELILEHGGGVVGFAELMAGEFCRQIEALPRMAGERAPHDQLGQPAVIGIGGVKVVHALLDGPVDHFIDLLFIDRAVRQRGQAHRAKAELRERQILKSIVNHRMFLPL